MKSARILPFAKELITACHRLHRTGLCRGATSQMSAMDEDILWINPTDISFSDLQPEHLIPVLPDGRVLGESTHLSEARLALHQGIYQARPVAKAIVITRPPKLVALLSHVALSQAQQSEPGIHALKHFAEPFLILPTQKAGTGEAGHHRLVGAVRGSSHRFIFSIDLGLIHIAETIQTACDGLEEAEVAAEIEWLQSVGV